MSQPSLPVGMRAAGVYVCQRPDGPGRNFSSSRYSLEDSQKSKSLWPVIAVDGIYFHHPPFIRFNESFSGELVTPPLVFISHKHADKAIAEVVAKFLRSTAAQPIRAYLSSNPAFEGPKIGQQINRELVKALCETDVLILIYTSEDKDWSWCMWECGVATDDDTTETNMIVFQCGPESPKVFAGTKVVDVRKLDDVKAFTKQYFTDPNFYPSMKSAMAAHFALDITDKRGAELYENLKKVLPDFGPAREWPTWPFLRVEVPLTLADQIKDVTHPIKLEEQSKLIKNSATVSFWVPRALEIFGRVSLDQSTKFTELEQIWKSAYPGAEAGWFESCCEQIAAAAAEKLPSIRPISVRQVNSETEFVPVVTHVRRISSQSTVQFDIYFFDVPWEGVQHVSSKMLTVDRFYWKPLDSIDPGRILLLDLVKELKEQGKNRLPLLDNKQRAKYIIHRSKIEEFIVSNLSTAPALTMKDLLANNEMRSMFETTFVVVSEKATLEEAKAAMRKVRDCRDIFATATGKRDEPVLGWLTNVDVEDGTAE